MVAYDKRAFSLVRELPRSPKSKCKACGSSLAKRPGYKSGYLRILFCAPLCAAAAALRVEAVAGSTEVALPTTRAVADGPRSPAAVGGTGGSGAP